MLLHVTAGPIVQECCFARFVHDYLTAASLSHYAVSSIDGSSQSQICGLLDLFVADLIVQECGLARFTNYITAARPSQYAVSNIDSSSQNQLGDIQIGVVARRSNHPKAFYLLPDVCSHMFCLNECDDSLSSNFIISASLEAKLELEIHVVSSVSLVGFKADCAGLSGPSFYSSLRRRRSSGSPASEELGLAGVGGARARRRRDSPLHLRVTALSPSIFIVSVFAYCLASVSLCAFSVTTHLACRLIVISSARICVAVSPLRAWVRAGSVQSVSKLTGSVRLFVTMATPSLIRAKSLPPPSDLSLTSPNLVSRRRASPTGIFRRRDRPITTATTTPTASTPCSARSRLDSPDSRRQLPPMMPHAPTTPHAPLIRAKSLPPPSDLSLTSPNLVSRRRASPTGIFRRRDRPITTATTTPCALRLCFSPVLILKPGSPSVTPSQPPQDSKYSVLSPFSTRLTGLTMTALSDDASCSDGALGAIICQRKTLILVGLMGLGLATRSSATNLFSKRYICFHSWTWAVCITKITESVLSTGSPSRPLPLVYRPFPNPNTYPAHRAFHWICFLILIVFSEITDGDRVVCLQNYLASSRCSLCCLAPSQTHSLGCINVVYDYGKIVGAFVSGIQVKIIQGFLHIELASPTNISILCFSVLFVVHLTVEINSGFIVLPSSIAPVVST
ncbi:hypothetical protein F2Q69_00061683 [Brassica cretica]|uniref:Uncharacterized protein n=1 Tax=Brassica cretica TaxID=69181 RepID=A0A8S9RB88_BRACR|nr:hypothetical protein F2Q69_00061683 [Brassica cretica]